MGSTVDLLSVRLLKQVITTDSAVVRQPTEVVVRFAGRGVTQQGCGHKNFGWVGAA